MTVTTARAARPSLARRASEPVDHGSTTAIDAVDGGDALESGRQGRGDGGVVDVDAVGDDGDLAAGLGEVVEPLGDAAGFGAGSGAEARGEHREGRAADGAGADEQHDPEGDDRTTAANDERSE